MKTGKILRALGMYLAFVGRLVDSINPPSIEKVPLGRLGEGFDMRIDETYWIRRALSELVGLRVRIPYVTPRGAFIHEATIKRVFVIYYRIEVAMSDGLVYSIDTEKLRTYDLVNFTMLLSDDNVRNTLMNAVETVRRESTRVAMFMQDVVKIIDEVSKN